MVAPLNDSPRSGERPRVRSIAELLDLSRRVRGTFRARRESESLGSCEVVAEFGEIRSARCNELFGEQALKRISLDYLPLQVEIIPHPRRRDPYYADCDEQTARVIVPKKRA